MGEWAKGNIPVLYICIMIPPFLSNWRTCCLRLGVKLMNQVKYGAPRDSKEPGTSINSCTLDGVDIRRCGRWCGYQKVWISEGVDINSSWDISSDGVTITRGGSVILGYFCLIFVLYLGGMAIPWDVQIILWYLSGIFSLWYPRLSDEVGILDLWWLLGKWASWTYDGYSVSGHLGLMMDTRYLSGILVLWQILGKWASWTYDGYSVSGHPGAMTDTW